MIKIKLILISYIIIQTSVIYTQIKPCTEPAFNELDFWLGVWHAEWTNDKGIKEYGSNVITKILGNCIIEENFTTSDSSFMGKSFSTYDTNNKIWHQTWVDNSGGYMVFEGGPDNKNFLFSRNVISKDGVIIFQRMVFSDITENSFNWDWQLSTDYGLTWKTSWSIKYKKK